MTRIVLGAGGSGAFLVYNGDPIGRQMKSRANFVILIAAAICVSASVSCHQVEGRNDQTQNAAKVTEKQFAPGGSIEMQLEGGKYTIRPATGDQIRVALGGNAGNARVELTAEGTRANLAVKDTPHRDFQATIEVPKTADLVVRLKGGELVMSPITGNKDIESGAGDVEIAAGDVHDYASVDASVKVGDLDAGPFGKSADSGLSPHFTWSGHGKYTLRASLGAGDLKLRQ